MCASEMAAETSAEKILVRSAAARGHVGVLSKEGSRSGYRDTDSRENMLMSRVASTAMSIAVSFFFFFSRNLSCRYSLNSSPYVREDSIMSINTSR